MVGNYANKNRGVPKNIYDVSIIQRGRDGRTRNDEYVSLYFSPPVSALPEGNRDYIRVHRKEYSTELPYLKKGKRMKLGFDNNEIVSIGI